MSSILSTVGGTVVNYALDYVNSTAFPDFLYKGAWGTAKGAGLALGFSGKVTSLILSKVNSKMGETAAQTQDGIALGAAKADEWATVHIFEKRYPDFTPAELTGPVLWSAFCGWMAARSVHRFAKEIKMLATGERLERTHSAKKESPGARVVDGKYKPYSGKDLGLSTVRSLLLAPICAGLGYYLELGITNRLTGLGANSLPIPVITMSAAALYVAVQFNAWRMAKENQTSINIKVETENEQTTLGKEE